MVSLEEWKRFAKLSDEDPEQFNDMFNAILKLQPPITKVAHAITRCCADIALALCPSGYRYEIGYHNKHLRKTIQFLSTLIKELEADFSQQIAEQDNNKLLEDSSL